MYGQELNPETWAIARSDLMIKDTDPGRMALGNTLTAGRVRAASSSTTCWPTRRTAWTGRPTPTRSGRGRQAGLRRPLRRRPAAVSDGSFLFLQHMLSQDEAGRRRPEDPVGRRRLPHRHRAVRVARCSPARPVPGSRRSAAGSSRTTGSKASSPYPTRCSTTPASPPTCGSSPTASPTTAAARSRSSTPASWAPRCARASATSARNSPTRPSPRSPSCSASARLELERTRGSR